MSQALDYLVHTRGDALGHYFAFLREAGRHLDPKTRALISVITKVDAQTERGLRQYLKRALREGCTPLEVLDALLMAFPTLGLAKILWAVDVILAMDLPGFAPEAVRGAASVAPPPLGADRPNAKLPVADTSVADTSVADAPVDDPADAEPPVGDPADAEPPVADAQIADPAATPRWHDLLATDALGVGLSRWLECDGRAVFVHHHAQGWRVYDSLCPHQGSVLGADALQGGRLICPKHGHAFDLASGDCVRGGSGPLRPWPSEVADGRLRAFW